MAYVKCPNLGANRQAMARDLPVTTDGAPVRPSPATRPRCPGTSRRWCRRPTPRTAAAGRCNWGSFCRRVGVVGAGHPVRVAGLDRHRPAQRTQRLVVEVVPRDVEQRARRRRARVQLHLDRAPEQVHVPAEPVHGAGLDRPGGRSVWVTPAGRRATGVAEPVEALRRRADLGAEAPGDVGDRGLPVAEVPDSPRTHGSSTGAGSSWVSSDLRLAVLSLNRSRMPDRSAPAPCRPCRAGCSGSASPTGCRRA